MRDRSVISIGLGTMQDLWIVPIRIRREVPGCQKLEKLKKQTHLKQKMGHWEVGRLECLRGSDQWWQKKSYISYQFCCTQFLWLLLPSLELQRFKTLVISNLHSKSFRNNSHCLFICILCCLRSSSGIKSNKTFGLTPPADATPPTWLSTKYIYEDQSQTL